MSEQEKNEELTGTPLGERLQKLGEHENGSWWPNDWDYGTHTLGSRVRFIAEPHRDGSVNGVPFYIERSVVESMTDEELLNEIYVNIAQLKIAGEI